MITNRLVHTSFRIRIPARALAALIFMGAVLVAVPAPGFASGAQEPPSHGPDNGETEADSESNGDLETGADEETETGVDVEAETDIEAETESDRSAGDALFDYERDGRREPVALVLGGGGAWGAAHIGVLEVLEEESIPIDMIVGTSAGAVAGAFYLDGYSTDDLSAELENLPLLEVIRPSLGGIGFFSTEPLEEFFQSRVSTERIEDFPVTFAVTATDINTGESLAFHEGPLSLLLTASMAIPVVFDPVEYDGNLLADGGIVDNVPVAAARSLGAETIIAVNVGGGFAFTGEPESRTEYANRIYNIMRKALHDEADVDVYINPDLDGISGTDFDAHREITRRGREAAEAMVPDLRELFDTP